MWNADEDERMLAAIERHKDKRGRPSWKHIADELDGRSVAMCRNRYARMLAAPESDEIQANGRPPNRCTFCDRLKKGHSCRKRVELDVITETGRKRPLEDVVDLDLDLLVGWVVEEQLEWPLEDLIKAVEQVV
mmetsp:Transcript_20832/g.53167  ORF Transcript_20832/g.53167 Transcript_20832/m.53167 type:complete len:133 (-) Transcript_20832:255-653(-)